MKKNSALEELALYLNKITCVGMVALAESIADELRDFSGVAEVAVLGAAEQSIEVALDPAAVTARGLTPEGVAAAEGLRRALRRALAEAASEEDAEGEPAVSEEDVTRG